jgi:hypothetical protein
MKIFKMGYTIDDFESKGPEVVQIRDILADLLQTLGLQGLVTHGFECSDPLKLINAYVICQLKLDETIQFIQKNLNTAV